jgi:hypothetical protein
MSGRNRKKRNSLPEEALENHGSGSSSRQQGSTHGDSLQSHIHHLAPVACAAAVEEVRHVVSTGEGSVRDLLAQELAQRSPAIFDLVLEQSLRRNQAANLRHVIKIDLLALVGEVAAEERFEELVQHGVVHAGGPAEVGNEAVFGIGDTPVNGLHDGTANGVRLELLLNKHIDQYIRMP